jgi:hypothetical protein
MPIASTNPVATDTMLVKLCSNCGTKVPATRRAQAVFCSNECQQETNAKRELLKDPRTWNEKRRDWCKLHPEHVCKNPVAQYYRDLRTAQNKTECHTLKIGD